MRKTRFSPSVCLAVALAAAWPSAGGAGGGDLTAAEALEVAQASFDAYPWRMRTSVVVKGSGQTVNGLVEAQSRDRVHVVSRQPAGSDAIVLDSIVIGPALYVKATGPQQQIRRYGFTAGQWAKVPKDSPVAGFAEMALRAARPGSILDELGLTKRARQGNEVYRRVGSERVNGRLAELYAITIGGPAKATAVTYRLAVGASDRRVYRMESDGPQRLATTVVEYDPGIRVEPPVR